MNFKSLLTLAIAGTALCSCGHTLKSESGLYQVPLKHSYKTCADGVWSCGKAYPDDGKANGYVYIAPLDISRVEAKEPQLAPLLIPQMQRYVEESMQAALEEGNRSNRKQWQLCSTADKADIRIDMAVVHLRPQRPILHVFSKIGGLFCPVPGVSDVAARLAKGDICLEGIVKDTHSGELLLAFKDSNPENTRLYKAEAYQRSGQADLCLQRWAKELGRLARMSRHDQTQGQSLQKLLRRRGLRESLKARMD